MKTAMGWFSRDSAGNLVVDGLGFRPKAVIFFVFGLGAATECWSNGADDGSYHECIFKEGDVEEPTQDLERSICIMFTAINRIRAYISSIGPDGFTLTWDLAGAATAYGIYLALG